MATFKAIYLSCILSLAACQLGQGESEVGSMRQHGITLNGITLNGIANTEQGRELLAYFSYCALPADETITAQDEAGETYEFTGRLGLVPEWRDRALTDTEKNWVSSCLIAHVNAVGAHVEISVRAQDKLTASADEISEFSTYEGTFFGRLHTEEPTVYSCIGDAADVALAISDDRALRICTDESDDCEVVSLGRCRDVCETRNADYGWTDCWANGERYSETLSVYLRSTDADHANQTCADGTCEMRIDDGDAGILDCNGADNCATACKDDSICAIDGTAAGSFDARVNDDAIADINCQTADQCSVNVSDHSSVEIDCNNANDCTGVVCKDGSDCLLDCTGAAECSFAVCEGELTYCPGDIVVCGRGCP